MAQKQITGFMKLSIVSKIPFDGALSTALLTLWDPSLNCFVMRRGLMTVTLDDIVYIVGFSPSGIFSKDLMVEEWVETVDASNLLKRASVVVYHPSY